MDALRIHNEPLFVWDMCMHEKGLKSRFAKPIAPAVVFDIIIFL